MIAPHYERARMLQAAATKAAQGRAALFDRVEGGG